MQPTILAYNEKDVLQAPITGTEVIVAGDLVDVTSSGYIYKMDASGDDATFAGLALDSSATGQTARVAFVTRCLAEVDCTAMSAYLGKPLKWADSNKVNTGSTGSNVICWAADYYTGSNTRIKVLVDAVALGKKFYPGA